MSAPSRTAAVGVWHRQGEMWIVGLGSQRTPLRDSKGLAHLHHLLERPGQEISALDMVGAVEGTGGATGEKADAELAVGGLGDAGSVLDAQAKAEYRQRLADTQAEVEEAERFHDPERAARARIEMEFLAKELSAAVGLGGRDRKVGAASERARVNVTRAIRSVVDRIAEHDQALAVHLRGTIRTGTYCSYSPPPGELVAWDFAGDGGAAPAAADGAPLRRMPREPRARPPGPELVERDAELALISEALARAASGAGGALLLEGPAGIGKSALLAAAVEAAIAEGFEVLRARATELESRVPFAVARQLFETPLRAMSPERRTEVFRGAVTPAAVMLGYGDPEPDGQARQAQPFDVHNGLYWLCAALAEDAPLALLLDDAQWADEQTLGWLQFMAARVADVPVLLVVADRSSIAGEVTPLLDALVDVSGIEVVAPAPLTDEAIARVVRLTWPEAADEFCAACVVASAGNPFYLREIVAAARAAGVEPTPEGAIRLKDVRPESVSRLVLNRLRRLGPDAEAMVRACVVLGPHAELAAAARLSALDEQASLSAAEALAEAGIVRALRPLEFTHPLIRGVIDAEIPLGVRALLHERAAELLAERRLPASDIAVHLVQSRPSGSADAVECLCDAARQATADGAPDSAVRFLERALAEPPADEGLPIVLLELARALDRCGRLQETLPHLRRALAIANDRTLRAAIVLELSRADDASDLSSRIAALDQAIASVEDVDRELRFRLEARAIELLGYAIVVTASPHVKRQHDERLERVAAIADGGTAGERQLLSIFAVQKAVAGEISAAEARSLALRALDDGVLMQRLAEGVQSCDSAIEVLSLADAFDQADRNAHEAELYARARGLSAGEAYACMLRAMVALHRGSLLELEALLGSVWAILGHAPDAYVESAANQLTACACIERGDLAGAEDACETLARSAFSPIVVPHTQGLLYAARGEHDLAAGELRAALETHRTAGVWRRTIISSTVRSDLAISLAALGDRSGALAIANEELELARHFGAPSALGRALRALGHADSERALEHLTEAAEVLAGSQAVLIRAQVLHDLGAAQRAGGAGEEARENLSRALQLAEHAGARRLAELVREELALAGVRAHRSPPTGSELLSARERRVAVLASEGVTEREIAQALFLHIHEVEEGLASALSKLGIDSRSGLAAALAPEPVAA